MVLFFLFCFYSYNYQHYSLFSVAVLFSQWPPKQNINVTGKLLSYKNVCLLYFHFSIISFVFQEGLLTPLPQESMEKHSQGDGRRFSPKVKRWNCRGFLVHGPCGGGGAERGRMTVGDPLGVDKPPAHFLPKEKLKMLDFRIPYWRGQWDLSFNQKPKYQSSFLLVFSFAWDA